jgi:hypothetical protein
MSKNPKEETTSISCGTEQIILLSNFFFRNASGRLNAET